MEIVLIGSLYSNRCSINPRVFPELFISTGEANTCEVWTSQIDALFVWSDPVYNAQVRRLSLLCFPAFWADLDEDNPYRNPSVGLDPNAILIIEKFAPQRQLIKSLLRPYLITDPGTILLLKLMSYDNEHGSLTLLDSMQDYLPELEHVNGEVFVRIVDAFLDLAAVHDRYDSAKLSYLVNKGNPSGTPWQYIIIKIQPLLRWRLLYFLMKAQERDERIKEDTPPPREWDRVLDWMNRDKANAPTMPGEAWLDKEEIYEWASHVESM